jgi:hypothetical protein
MVRDVQLRRVLIMRPIGVKEYGFRVRSLRSRPGMTRVDTVMPGFMPGIHAFVTFATKQDVDGRDKPGHDGLHKPPCTTSNGFASIRPSSTAA